MCWVDPMERTISIECPDAFPPTYTHTCGICPPGHRGDGYACERCPFAGAGVVEITGSTTVESTTLPYIRGSNDLSIYAALRGMEEGCLSTGGYRFAWAVESLDEVTKVPLDADTNKNESLALYIPAGSIAVGQSYVATLQYWLGWDSSMIDKVSFEFQVRQSPLPKP